MHLTSLPREYSNRLRVAFSPRFGVWAWYALVFVFSAAFFLFGASFAEAYTRAEWAKFQRSIIDYRSWLNPNFPKIKRKETKYIIVHTSESGLQGTLCTISAGKRTRTFERTVGGHAHYVISRRGTTYYTLDKDFRADHAGESMWNGKTDISSVSIGIELVGYHYTPITNEQYRSLGILIDILKNLYHLQDRDVLTHSQVAYGDPNRWVRDSHRGRKRCASNFDRAKACLGFTWPYDPDVRAGRLTADPMLSAIFYEGPKVVAAAKRENTNIITHTNTAWLIAGEDYDSPATLYKLPNGRIVPGDKIETVIGWNRVPPKTEVMLNQEQESGGDEAPIETPIKTITENATAWSYAGRKYNSATTFYFLPNGLIKAGPTISDWDDLPKTTRLVMGYRGPYPISLSRNVYRIAGTSIKNPTTVYFIPPNTLLCGNKIADFNNLPSGTLVFLPI
jgi:N-acetylmuramoyl-L-alanine amidase